MVGWQIKETGKLEKINKIEPLSDIDSVKVKITKTLITEDDIAFIMSEKPLCIIPGRMAIGQITELPYETEYLKKSTKVCISATRECGKCNNCINGNTDKCYDFQVAGLNVDGFLKDFAVLKTSDVHTYPATIPDQEIIYLEYVSLALSVIDKLNIEKGEHVAIFGASVFGSALAQLIIYYQGVPIVIDDDEEGLLLAKKSGIYYTIKSGAKLEKEISAITGGRMVGKTVYITGTKVSSETALKLSAPFGKVAFAGFCHSNVRAPLSLALGKQLECLFITSGYGNEKTAINILANKAIDFSNYTLPITKMDDIDENIEKMCRDYEDKKEIKNLLIDMLG